MRFNGAKEGYDHYRIPALVATKSGALLACYECRDSGSDWANIDIEIVRSEDGGCTWSQVDLIKCNQNTLNNPTFIVDENTVHFLYCEDYYRVFYRKSEDDGKTFGDKVEITDIFDKIEHTVVAIGPGHGITHNGVLLVPVWFANNKENLRAHQPSFVATIYSRDGGASWQVGARIDNEKVVNASECALAVNKNGEVVISIRNENDCKLRAVAKSKTGIDVWRDFHFESNLVDPVCQGSMCTCDGKIYHINCDSADGRKNLTVKITDDDFNSVTKILVDDEGGYSDIAIVGEKIYVLYERDWGKDGLYFRVLERK